MRTVFRLALAAAAVAAPLALAAPAGAVTFANFTQVGTARTIHWVRDANSGAGALNGSFFTGPNASTHGAVGVRFNFQLPALANFNNLPALFTVEAREMGHAASFTGPPDNVVTQTGVDGNGPGQGFSIIYNGPNTVIDGHAVNTGANLLSAKFTNLWIQGVRVSNAGAASDSDPVPGTITFTSDFMNFSGNTTERGLSWNLTSISPLLQYQAGRALPSFNASITGSFSAEFAVPEPMTWALMITGFGLTGAALRRRRMVLVRA